MVSASIILPQKLLVKLKDKAEESDSLPDELAAAGKEFLGRGDLVQASENLCVKQIKLGVRLR